MDYVGIDLHKTSSQICTLSEGGELTIYQMLIIIGTPLALVSQEGRVQQ